MGYDRELDNAALGLAIVTALASGDTEQVNRLLHGHIRASPSVEQGTNDIINGLIFTASTLLTKAASAANVDETTILQEIGMLYADREGYGREDEQR
ncbi:hypothetical protein [Micromonospora sp. KC213]|uniref:hypothetical protein n=1 Tax=Micromonospora sp. KC213 TaxID=2530378 RepID=UPI001048151D|nr:hypothetical protein [Micromonospora sp. KC213]TDC42077.1 hypothetical protein E1166_08950 [Micromonospora sp. KC213]